jgi:hypothetical protein
LLINANVGYLLDRRIGPQIDSVHFNEDSGLPA